MSVIAANSCVLWRELKHRETNQFHGCVSGHNLLCPKTLAFWSRASKKKKVSFKTEAFWSADVSKPSAVEMESINDSDQLDRILSEADQLSQPILIDWMASWCRKCIYLKPKLEKLAAEFDTKVKFYCVDVNKVPQNLVKRGNISKMPTIQVWKDGEMKEEVIGGQKAWVVVDEVSQMLKKYV